MAGDGFIEDQARNYMKDPFPTLGYWKNHAELSYGGKFEALKKQLVNEINELQIKGMPKLEGLSTLVDRYVNLEYPLPSGACVKFLDDQTTYLGNQLESEIVIRCFPNDFDAYSTFVIL